VKRQMWGRARMAHSHAWRSLVERCSRR
jgi:hypothetical protein